MILLSRKRIRCLVPIILMEEAFGIDGDVMLDIAREISEAR